MYPMKRILRYRILVTEYWRYIRYIKIPSQKYDLKVILYLLSISVLFAIYFKNRMIVDNTMILKLYQNTLICTGTIIIKRILSVTKAWYNCCCFWVIISLSIALFFENQKVKTVIPNTTNETSWVCFISGRPGLSIFLYHVVLTSRIYTPSNTYAPAKAPAAPSTFSNVEIAAVLPSFFYIPTAAETDKPPKL